MRQESMNPGELKKEITQLEQEKEQLLTKIHLFKNKSNKQDFHALLEATSKLRKEQEQDAKLAEKERELSQMIEYYESNVLTVKQRLLDVRKINDQNLGPDKMLENLRTETRRNRELNNEILGRELNDKRERLQRTELLLQLTNSLNHSKRTSISSRSVLIKWRKFSQNTSIPSRSGIYIKYTQVHLNNGKIGLLT